MRMQFRRPARFRCGKARKILELANDVRHGAFVEIGDRLKTSRPLMRRIDELFTIWPFLGSPRMTAMLRAEGYAVNRKRVRRLMRKMEIAALGSKPRTTVLAAAGIRISMGGRGRWMDNVFIERLWRSLKHEDIYLKGRWLRGPSRHRIVGSLL